MARKKSAKNFHFNIPMGGQPRNEAVNEPGKGEIVLFGTLSPRLQWGLLKFIYQLGVAAYR